MGGFIEPNIHPVLVHFAYALTVSSALAYLACRFLPAGGWRDSLKPAADWMLAIAAFTIVATVAAGFYAYYTVAHDAPSHEAMTTHRNWAVPSGLLVLALASWRWLSREKAPGVLFAATMAAAALMLSVTAWWGGTIVYKYGLGVQSLPESTGDVHDHDHGAAASPPQNNGGHEHAADNAEPDAREIKSPVPAGHDNSDGHHDSEVSTDEEAIRQIISDIQTGWETGNGTPFRDHFLNWEGARYFESGGENKGLDDLIVNHVEPEKDAIPDLALGVSNLQVHFEGQDLAWVVSDTTVRGTLSRSGEALDRTGKQTWILRKIEGEWKILHTHSSSRKRRR